MPTDERPVEGREASVRVVRSATDASADAVVDNMSLFSAGSWSLREVVTDPFWLTTWRGLIDGVLHARRLTYFAPNEQALEAYGEPPARQVLSSARMLEAIPLALSPEQVPIGEAELTRQAEYAVKVLTDRPSRRIIGSAYDWLASCRRGGPQAIEGTEPCNEEFDEFWNRELEARVAESLRDADTPPEKVKSLMRLSVRGVQYQQLVEQHLVNSHYIDHPMRRRSALIEHGTPHTEFLLDWSPLLQIQFEEARTSWPKIAEVLGKLRSQIRDQGLHPDDQPFERLEIGQIRERCRDAAYRSGVPLEWDEAERAKVLRLLRRESSAFQSTTIGTLLDVGIRLSGAGLAAEVAKALASSIVSRRLGWWIDSRVDEKLSGIKRVPPGLGRLGARLVRRDYFQRIDRPQSDTLSEPGAE